MADADVVERAKVFAGGRCTAERFCKPPEQKFAEAWYPKIAGLYVRPDGMPEHGYDTKAEALDGARWFKAHAQAVLNGSIEELEEKDRG